MPPKTTHAKFQFLTPKNPGIENSSNQKILRSFLKLELRSNPLPPRAPLELPNEIFSYLLHLSTRSILCVGKCTKLSKDVSTEFSSTKHSPL